MGKIRVKTLGDEQKEKQDKKKAKVRSEAKKTVVEEKPQKEIVEEKAGKTNEEAKVAQAKEEKLETNPLKSVKKSALITKIKKQSHSKTYKTLANIVDKNKEYSLKEALEILPKLKRHKFDETVELHINTLEQGISGNLTLPHGTGKTIRIEIVNQTENPKHVEDVVKKVETGKIDFDILIATPDAMPKLARVARFLGPRGLMPNPKNGTVTPKPQEVAKKFEAGQINFKTEAKSPILHLSVGKVSFGNKKLADNIQAALTAVQPKNIKNITLKSTMSPGIKIDYTTI